MRKVILLTAMPKEGVWSSSIYVNGGGKLLSSKISFSRILLLFVCCIVCNNVLAQNDNDWRLVQDFESLTNSDVKACTSTKINNSNDEADDVVKYTSNQSQNQVVASISDGVGTSSTNSTKVAKLSKNFTDNSKSYGIVFSVSLGSNKLSDYRAIKLETYTTDSNKPLSVYVRESGTNDNFKKLFVINNGFGNQGGWIEIGGDSNGSITTTSMDYSSVEFYIGYSPAYESLDVYIDNIQLKGPAIGSSSVDISESADNTITAQTGATVNLTRSLVKGTWNTICLPFVPTSEQVIDIFGEGAKFAEFSSVSNGVMQFTSVAVGSLVAGTPYLVLPTENLSTDNPVVLTRVCIPATAIEPTPVEHDGYKFIGIYSPTPFAKEDWDAIRFVGTGNNLLKPNVSNPLKPNESNPLKALRAYFTVGASNGAKKYTFAVDSFVPTSIANIQIEGDGDGAIYNIGGQRVEGKSLPKGIYIREGKKFVVK